MLHYYLFFLLLVLIFTDEKDWKNLFRFSITAAALMILYGIAGNFSVPGFIGPYAGATPPTGWWNQLIQGRFEGSLGNPAYVDPYLIFSMFFAAYLWLASKLEGTLNAWKSWGYGILIAIFFLFFVLGQTRGAFLGLIVGVFVLVLYLIFSSKGKPAQMGRYRARDSRHPWPWLLRGKEQSGAPEIPRSKIASDQPFRFHRADPFLGVGRGMAGIPGASGARLGSGELYPGVRQVLQSEFLRAGTEQRDVVRPRAQRILRLSVGDRRTRIP